MAACQTDEDATTNQDATTASSSTLEPETFTTLTAWGFNGSGQLGNGTTTDSSTPVQVSEAGEITAIAAGGAHSLAVQ